MLEHSRPVKGAVGNVRLAPGTGEDSGRRTLPRAAAFWILAGLFLMLFFAADFALRGMRHHPLPDRCGGDVPVAGHVRNPSS